jgi:hypothetical protein
MGILPLAWKTMDLVKWSQEDFATEDSAVLWEG